jgi:hypothetical protein
MATATVTITSDPEVVTSPQIVSTLVSLENSAPEEHVAVWFSDDSRETCEALRRKLKGSHPGAIVSIVTDDSEGSCSCLTEFTVREHPFSVAAALAVIKSSWGWDENDPMHVRINGNEIRVRTRYDGNRWTVTDRA